MRAVAGRSLELRSAQFSGSAGDYKDHDCTPRGQQDINSDQHSETAGGVTRESEAEADVGYWGRTGSVSNRTKPTRLNDSVEKVLPCGRPNFFRVVRAIFERRREGARRHVSTRRRSLQMEL